MQQRRLRRQRAPLPPRRAHLRSPARWPMREICHRADVPQLSLIGLRHSCETYLAERGCNVQFQVAWMGLKSPRMLWKHYRHLTQPIIDGGAAAMNA